MVKELPQRKRMRAAYHDYSDGVYFVTMCTQNRRCILSQIVGTGVLDGPQIVLKRCGEIAEKYIRQMDAFYENIAVDGYVIMPNHIHLLLVVKSCGGGPSGTPVPTLQNSVVSRFVSTFKRFCNKECGENIWQYRSYDHVIRSVADYDEHAKYICENPARWQDDELYCAQ